MGRSGSRVVSPDEVGPTVQAKGVEVDHSAHAAERQSLLVAVTGSVVTSVQEQFAASIDASPRGRLQGREGQNCGHGWPYPRNRSRIARVAGD